MTVAFRQDIVGGVDPHGIKAGTTAELWQSGLMYEFLVNLGTGYTFQPGLATSWESSDDQMTWTFHLRSGVTFSDGSPFDAAAVKANFDNIFTAGTTATAALKPFFEATDVEVVDDDAVTFHLKQAYSLFPALLGQFPTGMVSKQALDSGVDLTTTAVGTGPFLYDGTTPGVDIRFKKNPNYWGKDANGTQLPYLDEIVFKVITDTSQRLNAVRTGEADIGMFLDSSQKGQLGDAVPVVDPTARLGVITLNSTAKPFDDERVRQAFSLALDRDALLKVGEGGVGEAAFGLFPKSSPYYDASVESADGAPYSHQNVDEAKKLLADAGYPDGLDLGDQTIMAQSEFPDLARAAEAAVEMLKQAGIRFKGVQVCPLTECGAIRKSGNWTATSFAFPVAGEPYMLIDQLYTSTGKFNIGNGNLENLWDLSSTDAAVKAPLAAPEDSRFDLGRTAQADLLEVMPGTAIQLFFMPQFDATQQNVVNYTFGSYFLQRDWAQVGFQA